MHPADNVFYYHADCNAVGGFLTHPRRELLSFPASSSLPQAGGEVSTSAVNLSYRNTIHVRQACTHVTGAEQSGRGWTTLVTAVVEGVNFLDVLTADRITARLSVEHRLGSPLPIVSVTGSRFDNLRVAGSPLELPILHDLFESPARATDKPWPADPHLIDVAVRQSKRIATAERLPEALKNRYNWVQSDKSRGEKGYLLCSLVEEIGGSRIPGTAAGHILTIPGFGTLFFGELVVTGEVFRLSMVRAELGCSVEGTVSFACANSNGRPMP